MSPRRHMLFKSLRPLLFVALCKHCQTKCDGGLSLVSLGMVGGRTASVAGSGYRGAPRLGVPARRGPKCIVLQGRIWGLSSTNAGARSTRVVYGGRAMLY